MPKVVEKSRSSPSVIARLMGLDELHPQVESELKSENEHSLLNKSSARLREKFECLGNHSFHVSRRKHRNFRIHNDLCDSSKAMHIDQVVQGEERYSKPGMDFIKQRFMQAKCLSTNEALQSSKGFNDAVDISDSNNFFFLKFHQEPNSLFAKHFHDLQYSKFSYHTSHFKILESSSCSNIENGETCCKKVEGTTECTLRKETNMHGCANRSTSTGNHSAHDYVDSHLPKLLRSQFAGKRESSHPASIVVLKPRIHIAKTTGKSDSYPRSHQNCNPSCRRHREFHLEPFVDREEQHSLFHINNKGCKAKDTSETTRDISAQTKQSLRRYSAEALASRIDICNPSTYMGKPSLSREDTNGLSERWKMTEPSRHRLIEGSNTLGEIFSLYDKEVPQTLGQLIFKDWSDRIADKEYLPGSWAYTYGISSNNAWKDERDAFLPRSEDYLNSSTLYVSLNTENRNKVGRFNPIDDCNTLKDMLNRKQHAWNNSIMDRDNSMLANFKHCDKSLGVFKSHDEENKIPVKEVKECQGASRNMINLNKLVEPKPIHVPRNMDVHLAHNCSKPKNFESDSTFLSNLKEFQQSVKCKDLSVILHGNEISKVPSIDFSLVKSLDKTQFEPPTVSEVAERLSPVSVLDPQSEGEKSIPECLEMMKTDLQRQLNLLELETSDFGVEQSKPLMFNDEAGREFLKSLKHGGGRDFLYLLDILKVSGIYASCQDKLFDACYSSDNPVFPDVFDKLENMYGMVNSWSRSERRQLFDHINSVLAEVLAPCIGLHPWVKSRSKAACSHDGLVNESWRMLVQQQAELGKGMPMDKVLDTRWLYLDDHVDMIGREIERMLKDDLLNELVFEFILG